METRSESPSRKNTFVHSINPNDGSQLAEYSLNSWEQIEERLTTAQKTFEEWRLRSVSARVNLIRKLGEALRLELAPLARLASLEMGKPIAQARAEVTKCEKLCEYYAAHAEEILSPQTVTGNAATRSYVRFDPLGAILAVMPWNYPFWQVLRFAIPTLLAGNVAVLKHASNVSGCALQLEKIFLQAGFPPGAFTTLVIDRTLLPDLIGHRDISAVTLTGSESAGISVAKAAGSQLKKCVLELGGSDPFIVLADADLPRTIAQAVEARTMNNGQTCIAAKRFIVHSDCYEDFVQGMAAGFRALRIGDPLETATQLGPLAREDLRETLHKQVEKSVTQGARLVTGGKFCDRPGWFYEPTLLADVTPEMTVFEEETFGPVAAVIRFESPEEAISLANQTGFGLGASVWTSDIAAAERMAERIESGSVFINDYTRSDATLPFGGVKRSGYGRELSHFGLREFVNIKTVWVH